MTYDVTPEVKTKTSTPTDFVKSGHMIVKQITVDGAARDSGNSPTNKLRKGLLLGKVTATGKYKQYDDTASDGTEVAAGILLDEVNVHDEDGNDQDRIATILVHGVVDDSKIYGKDASDHYKTDLPLIIFE